MSEDKFVLYGGPDPNPPSSKLTSLGEFVLQRLGDHGDKIALVSIFSLFKKKKSIIFFSGRWSNR